MPDLKISELGTATTIAGSELLAVVQGGTTKQVTVANIGVGLTSVGTLSSLTVGGATSLATSSGSVGIGTASPATKLDVRSGYITSGTGSSTNSSKILAGYYTSGSISTWGSEYSNGSPVMGYGVWPSTTAADAFVSSTPVAIPRGAYTIEGGNHKWYAGGTQTVAIDSAVTISRVMMLNASGNIGLGVTPSAWGGGFSVLEMGRVGTGFLANQSTGGLISVTNSYYDGTNYVYANSSLAASRYLMSTNGSHQWFVAPSGTAGATVSWTQALVVDVSANVGIGTGSPQALAEFSKATTDATVLQEVVRVSTTGRVSVGATLNRGTLLSFSDANNQTLTSAVGGIRENAAGNFGGALALYTNSIGSASTGVATLTERVRVKSGGQVRFVPLSSAPAGAENGDVYYDSSTNKLRVYAGGAWTDLH